MGMPEIYYTSTDPVFGKMTMKQFIETEVMERGNYTTADVQDWMRKYNLSMNDLAVWVSPLKWVANRYNLLAEEWDKARFIPESEMNVYEIKGNEGFIIPESDDGDEGYLFVFKEVMNHMIRESGTQGTAHESVTQIIEEVKKKPISAPEKRDEIRRGLTALADSIDRIAITELRNFRPLGMMSEFGVAMGAEPRKGVKIDTPYGPYVFDEKRIPSNERVDNWFAQHKEAEGIRTLAAEYGFGLGANPNTVTGNFRVVERGRRFKEQGMLSPEEERILNALEKYWQEHPELDRQKGYGIWAYDLEIMVPEKYRAQMAEKREMAETTQAGIRAGDTIIHRTAKYTAVVDKVYKNGNVDITVLEAKGIPEWEKSIKEGFPIKIHVKDTDIYFEKTKESLIDALLNIQPGRDVLISYGDIPKGAERITLPSNMSGVVIERRGNLVAVGIFAGASVATVLYVQKDSQLIRIRPIPHQKMQTRTGEIVNAPEYVKWVERIKKEVPEYLPEWEKISTKGTEAKQPWEMNYREFAAFFEEVWSGQKFTFAERVGKPLGIQSQAGEPYHIIKGRRIGYSGSQSRDRWRLAIVDKALSEGKTVPEDLIAELSESLKEEKEKLGGSGMAEQYEEKPPGQEVRDWMKRALGIEDYKGGRHDRIQMLALLIQNSELGNIRSISDSGSMALALGKDLGYGTPPAYGKSLERYYAEKIAAETGKEVPIIKSSDIIKPPAKELDVQTIFNRYTTGYSRLSLVAVTQLSDIKLAEDITSAIPEMTKEDALAIAPQVRALADAKAKEMEAQEIKAAPAAPEVPKVDFWGMVKDLKVTDVQVEFAPGEPGRGYKNIYLYTYAILENGKRVRMDEEIFKGSDVAQAQKMGHEQFRQRKLYMIGETVEKNVRESSFLFLNRYEEYVKQSPVAVQKRFEESGAIAGAIAGGTPARKILNITEPEGYYFGTQVEVIQGADPGLEPYFTGTVKRLLNNGELVEVHPEGDPMEVSFRVPVDRVNVIRLVKQEGAVPTEIKKLYRYYYSHRPSGIGTQPEGYINYESWLPAATTPHGRTAFGWVEYDRPLTPEDISRYELFEDEVELPKLVKELVQFAHDEGIDEAMKAMDAEYGKAVWDWLKSQKRLTTRGQKEQIRDEIMRLAGITDAPQAEKPRIVIENPFGIDLSKSIVSYSEINTEELNRRFWALIGKAKRMWSIRDIQGWINRYSDPRRNREDTIRDLESLIKTMEMKQTDIEAKYNSYIRSTMLGQGVLASPRFMNDEKIAQDIERNIQVSLEEARALVPQFRAIAEMRIDKEEVESVKEMFGIDLEQEAHNLGIDLADYAIIRAGNKVVLQHKTIVQRRYELKPPAGFMKRREEKIQAKLQEAAARKAPAVPQAVLPAGKQSLGEQIRGYGKWIKEHTTGEAGVKRLSTGSYEEVISNLKRFIRQYYNLSPTEDYLFERPAHRQVETSIDHLADTFFNVAANGWDLADTFKEWRPTQTRAEFEKQMQEKEIPVPPPAKPAETIQDTGQNLMQRIKEASNLIELQAILKDIGAAAEPKQFMDAYQNKFAMLKTETAEKPAVPGGPSKQEIWEAELHRKAEEGKKLRGQVSLGGAVSTAVRLGMFEPGAMEKAKAEAEARRRIEQQGLPYEVHPYIKRLAAGTQDVIRIGSKRGKETVEDLVLRRYIGYCPPGAIIDNRNVPKVSERWWVYPVKLRACMGEIEKKLAGAVVQECMVRENVITPSIRQYIQGAKAVRDVIHYFMDRRQPIRGVLYRARDGGYFVEAQDGQIYSSMGWDDVGTLYFAGEQKSSYSTTA